MEWMEFLILVLVAWFFVSSIDRVSNKVADLEKKVHDLSFRIGRTDSENNETIMQRLRSLELEVFGESGEITYDHRCRLRSRLENLEDRLNGCGAWLQLDQKNDQSKSELDDVTFCIRSAAYQLLKKPDLKV
jgi:hypothetical protein